VLEKAQTMQCDHKSAQYAFQLSARVSFHFILMLDRLHLIDIDLFTMQVSAQSGTAL